MLRTYQTIIPDTGKKESSDGNSGKSLAGVGGAECTSVEDAAIYLIRFGEKAAVIGDDY